MPAADDAGDASGWHVALDGEARGPFSRADVLDMIADGTVGPDTRVWRKGMDDWAAAASFVEFAGHFARAAPPAAPAPAALRAPPQRLDLRRAVDDAVAAFRRAPWRAWVGGAVYVLSVFLANSAAFQRLAIGGGEAAAVPGAAEVAPWLIGLLVVAVVLRAGFCLFTLRLLRGDAASPALVFAGLGRLAALVPFALLYGAAVFCGMLLLVIPGIFAAVVFSLGFYVIMESRLGPIAAMQASWRAVMALGWWPVFAVYLVSFLGIMVLAVFSGAVGLALGAPLAGEIVQLALVAAWTAATSLVIAAVYEQARRNQDRAPPS